MKKNLAEIVFILDRSGSMAGLEDDTIGGFNAMIEKQKREDGEAYELILLRGCPELPFGLPTLIWEDAGMTTTQVLQKTGLK